MAVRSQQHAQGTTAGRLGQGRVAPARLFGQLHGRRLNVASREWLIEVYSVVDRGGVRWIQLALDGTSRRTLTMRLRAGTGVAQVVRALTAWLSGKPEAGQI